MHLIIRLKVSHLKLTVIFKSQTMKSMISKLAIFKKRRLLLLHPPHDLVNSHHE